MNFYEKLLLYLRTVASLRSVNVSGLPLIPKKWISDLPYSRNAYNSFLLWIRKIGLSATDVVVDVGANHGDFAQAAGALFPAARVLLFEPLPDMQRYLTELIQNGRPRWQLLPCALGGEPGRFPLFVDDADDSIGSFVGFTHDYLKINSRARGTREIICEVRTLDAVIEEAKIQKIDLLKIDVEGFEFEVLKGAKAALQITQALIVEVSLIRRAPGDDHPLVEMLDLLTHAGFQVVEIIPSLFDPALPWRPAEFNVLMRRSDALLS